MGGRSERSNIESDYQRKGFPKDWDRIKIEVATSNDPAIEFLMRAAGAAQAAIRCGYRLQPWVMKKYGEQDLLGAQIPNGSSSRAQWKQYAAMSLGESLYKQIHASSPNECAAALKLYGPTGRDLLVK